ncbi:MAG: membrane protein insertion efficiency factor YidD [Bacteroidota bacterium]|nr:membrane protein insertion efficiency factor YidD [Bacteroidota bacterium]
MKYVLIAFVKLYQLLISPLFPASCRFSPTCSQYTLETLNKFGFLKGSYLAIKRILKCNPWGSHGHDPVPEK